MIPKLCHWTPNISCCRLATSGTVPVGSESESGWGGVVGIGVALTALLGAELQSAAELLNFTIIGCDYNSVLNLRLAFLLLYRDF